MINININLRLMKLDLNYFLFVMNSKCLDLINLLFCYIKIMFKNVNKMVINILMVCLIVMI